MIHFALPKKIDPIWPELEPDDPKYFLRKLGYHEDIESKTAKGDFLRACELGQKDAISAYVSLGIDLNFIDDLFNVTPLIKAVEEDQIETIKLLVEAGADIEAVDKDNDTPLMTAVNWTHMNSVKTLLELNANPNASHNYETSLSRALEDDNDELVQLLLSYGADSSLFADISKSVYHKAIDAEAMNRVKLLLERDDSNLCDKDGIPILVYALVRDSEEIVELLLHMGAKTDGIYNGWSFYDLAVFKNSSIINKIPENIHFNSKELLFLKASNSGDLNSVKEMIRSVDLNAKTFDNRNAIQLAISQEEYELAFFLAENGIDLTHVDNQGDNILGKCSDADTVIRLLKMGAPVNCIKDGKSICELLHPALINNNSDFLKALIEYGANLDDLSSRNATIIYGILPQQFKEYIEILKHASADLEAPDESGETLLISAASIGKRNFVKALILAKVNINAVDDNGESALIHACGSYDFHDGVLDVVTLLLNAGADYSLLNWQKQSCYDLALLSNNKYAINLIEKHMDKTIETASSEMGEVNFKELLRRSNYETFLHWVRNNNIVIVKGLLEAGFNSNSPSKKGQQALTVAIEKRYDELVGLLLQYNADPKTVGIYGSSPYKEAVYTGDIKYIKMLLSNGLNLDQAYECNPVVSAAAYQGIEMVKFLYEEGASLEKFPTGRSPFCNAVRNEDYELCEFLLSEGANLNFRARFGNTPLINSVAEDMANMVYTLLNAGAEVNCQNEDGETALIIATKKGNIEIIEILLNNGASPHICANNGESAISLASYRCELDFIFEKYQVKNEHQTHHNVVDKPLSALFYAVYSQNMRQFKKLLKKNNTDVNDTNYRGDTPLMVAIAFNSWKMMELLLSHGADVKKKNIFNDTAWSYSFVYKDEAIRKKLEKLGCTLSLDSLDQWADLSMRREDIVTSFKSGDIPKIITYLDNKKLDINYLAADQSPLEYASSLNDDALIEILLAKGADESLVKSRNKKHPFMLFLKQFKNVFMKPFK